MPPQPSLTPSRTWPSGVAVGDERTTAPPEAVCRTALASRLVSARDSSSASPTHGEPVVGRRRRADADLTRAGLVAQQRGDVVGQLA